MKTKKIPALFLTACLIVAIFAGCGSTEASASAKSAEASAVSIQESEELQPGQSQEEAASGMESEEIASAGDSTSEAAEGSAEDESSAPPVTINYPLPGSVSLTLWNPLAGWLTAMFGASSWSELPVGEKVEEATGVHLEYIEPSDTAANETFSLMIASGDYPDLLDCTGYSGGGLTAAANDDVILVLSDYMDENMPNYTALLKESDPSSIKNTIQDDGETYAIYTIMNTVFRESGLFLRQDWLDDMNMDVPETLDDLHEYLQGIQNSYGVEYPLWTDSTCILKNIVGAFGIAGADLSAGNSVGPYIEEGSVRDSLTSDGYRSYIEYMNMLYGEGIIHQDFLTTTLRGNDMAVSNQTGCFDAMAGQFAQLVATAEDPEFSLVGAAPVVKNKGDTYRFSDISNLTNASNGKHISVSTCCEDVNLALQYMDWFFGEDAKIFCNYGIEGLSFNYDDAGKPVYTDLVYNNNTKSYYGFQAMPCYDIHDSYAYLYPDAAKAAIEVWTAAADSSCTCPNLSYTADEAADYSKISAEIGTYASEVLSKFITGAEPINDETWGAYVDNIEAMGLEELLAIMQTAYERYENR